VDIALERINIISQICQFIEHSYLGPRDCGRISSFGTVHHVIRGLSEVAKGGDCNSNKFEHGLRSFATSW
jgi:hypothetical protein